MRSWRIYTFYVCIVVASCVVVYGFSATQPPSSIGTTLSTTTTTTTTTTPSSNTFTRTHSTTTTTTTTMRSMMMSQTSRQQQLLLLSVVPRGGGSSTSSASRLSASSTNTNNVGPIQTETKCPMTTTATIVASLWGTGGVLYILGKAIQRVVPIAMEPFQTGSIPLTNIQLCAYIATCLWFAYVEGYKGFQTKFSPLVVKRSFTLIPGKNGTKWYHYILAPLYSMGLVHATRKRQIVSWSVTIGVAAIVAIVKRLPYPYRNIIDAGVVAGLSWGSMSIMLLYIKSWLTGSPPTNVDAALPTAVIPNNNKAT